MGVEGFLVLDLLIVYPPVRTFSPLLPLSFSIGVLCLYPKRVHRKISVSVSLSLSLSVNGAEYWYLTLGLLALLVISF